MKKEKKERRHFTKEFKLKAVRMVENRKPDETLEDIAEDLAVHANLLSKWRKQYKDLADDVFMKQDPLLAELEKLRKENKSLQEDRDILKKALSIFGRQEKS